jgi:hypothetical protein
LLAFAITQGSFIPLLSRSPPDQISVRSCVKSFWNYTPSSSSVWFLLLFSFAPHFRRRVSSIHVTSAFPCLRSESETDYAWLEFSWLPAIIWLSSKWIGIFFCCCYGYYYYFMLSLDLIHRP